MIFVGILLFVIGAVIICVVTDGDPRAALATILVAAGAIIFISRVHPTAMDVYQGNTTLEYTYKNGVPVDSVVVLKDKEK